MLKPKYNGYNSTLLLQLLHKINENLFPPYKISCKFQISKENCLCTGLFFCRRKKNQNLRVCFSIIVLRIHDDGQVSGHTHPPGQTARGHQHLDCPARKEILHGLALDVAQSLVKVPYPITQSLLQSLTIKRNQSESLLIDFLTFVALVKKTN